MNPAGYFPDTAAQRRIGQRAARRREIDVRDTGVQSSLTGVIETAAAALIR
jgi:hypothetical protein